MRSSTGPFAKEQTVTLSMKTTLIKNYISIYTYLLVLLLIYL